MGFKRRLSIDVHEAPVEACTVAGRAAWSAGAFANDTQQDAHDAFCRLMDSCEGVDQRMLYELALPAGLQATLLRNNKSNADRYSTPFWLALGGVQKTTVTCSSCRSTSARYDMWHSLSVTLPEQPCTVEHLISDYFKSTPLDDPADRCDHEHCPSRLERRSPRRDKTDELVRWPPVIVLHLKRWEVVSIMPFVQKKVPTVVSYETLLAVDPHLPAYHLRGVVQHHGDAGGGHYTSTVRAPDNYWYYCNDETPPQRTTTADALSKEPMILVYERS